ncbi:MAG: 2,3-bisphosphoglycerate-independent phosphoglycerate mutase [Bdellovibrionales bacterium]|nr:2,3-bisphosphoglycerate-independent phosphoglycerate mutase [Bdellovibrionales bacterium]
MKALTKTLLLIIDGWGYREEKKGNAILMAGAQYYQKMLKTYPSTLLSASEHSVGLPAGVMGNSEVGHMNIGSGRRIVQDQVRIHEALDQKQLHKHEKWSTWVESAQKKNTRVHFMGLVSQGNVHSSEKHYLSFLKLAVEMGINPQNIFFHAFTDGRDTPPRSAKEFIYTLHEQIKNIGAHFASMSGRFYAMDRDQRWERTEKAYQSIVLGKGPTFLDPVEALEKSYHENISDEFFVPSVSKNFSNSPLIQSGDHIFFFNFRADRMRQIVRMFIEKDLGFGEHQNLEDLHLLSMTSYDQSYSFPVLFEKQNVRMGLGEYISSLGMSQFRCAETEKYAHVTFFFNGGMEKPFSKESRCLVPSPKVQTYDQCPEMSSEKVTQEVLKKLQAQEDTLMVVNYAQPDMVGHTGNFEAAIKAVQSMDRAMYEISQQARQSGYALWITADHGNIETMIDPNSGEIHTAHTLNPVPLILVDDQSRSLSLSKGSLSDLAPTMLARMGLDIPLEMTGKKLIS